MSWLAPHVATHGEQPDGQNPSVVPLHARGVLTHSKLQSAAIPVRIRMVLASPTQASYWV
jgi:hypothetical protein